MKKPVYHIIAGVMFVLSLYSPLSSQEGRKVEINAQSLLAGIDRFLEYPQGKIRGVIKMKGPAGNMQPLMLTGLVSEGNYLFTLSSRERGPLEKVLYRQYGEDIWVYRINSLKLFSLSGHKKMDPVLATGLTYSDLSHSSLQNNFTAEIAGSRRIKGRDAYILHLTPVYKTGGYSRLVVYAAKDNSFPLKFEFYDSDGGCNRFMDVSRVLRSGNRKFSSRYEIVDRRKKTVTTLSFFHSDDTFRSPGGTFRPENLKN